MIHDVHCTNSTRVARLSHPMMIHLCCTRDALPIIVELRFIVCEYLYKALDNKSIIDAVNMWKSNKRRCELTFGHISYWDTSQVTDMSRLFFNDSSPKLQYRSLMQSPFPVTEPFNSDISRWDVSNVTTMSFMFNGASEFNQSLLEWNVSNVTNMSGMFKATSAFNEYDMYV